MVSMWHAYGNTGGDAMYVFLRFDVRLAQQILFLWLAGIVMDP